MKILLIGHSFGFPNGTGATARVYAYAKGLIANGVTAQVLCLKTTERQQTGILNTEVKGAFEGIPFEYTCGATIRASSFWRRRWLTLKGAWQFLRFMQRADGGRRTDAVILFSSNSVLWTLLVVAASHLVGARCINEKSEFPFVYKRKTWLMRCYAWLYVRTVLKLFDGFIVISHYLERFIRTHARRGALMLHVPILVDAVQFHRGSAQRNGPRRKVAYAGHLGHAGEVANLMQAFALIAARHPDVDLQIIGNLPARDVTGELRTLAAELQIEGRVQFTGMVRRSDMPDYLGAADVLVLLREGGTFSTAGFPTKLGEYLATGKPVVVTSTGDIPLYLEDGVNAYLVPPGDKMSFAQRLDYVLSHPDEAQAVGRQGQEVALREFDCTANCRRIIAFVRTLQARAGIHVEPETDPNRGWNRRCEPLA